MNKLHALAASTIAVALALGTAGFTPAYAGQSGPRVAFEAQGHIGEVIPNPYRIAPLTAVIRNGGYLLKNATVRIVPKKGGQEIKYKVSDAKLLTYGGVPVFGLYPDYMNTVEVTYDRIFNGKTERFTDTFKIYAAPVYKMTNGNSSFASTMFNTKVLKTDPKFSDRLYLVNNFVMAPPTASRMAWNNPMGGALEWAFGPENAIIDSTGTVRWYMLPEREMYDPETIYHSGIMMGFRQKPDGSFTWGYGQRYVNYDVMGRKIFNRRLPASYADFSHALDFAQNGHTFLRVSESDYRRPDGKRVHTVRDVIAEVDEAGNVVDEFKLFDILDPYRANVIRSMDQGAVCLNIDASKAGKTLSSKDLAEQDKSNKFGDIAGVGPGRNWAHVNSVDYDPSDDSIIISSRHQSAVIKIGRDKKVKWILSSPEGWRAPWKDKVLKPIDKDGKPIKCEGSVCEKGFDWTWTQHTGWRIDSKSNKDVFYLSVFDNGDSRAMEQPALPSMKYTRGVIYKIDQKAMTVQQLWEVGKQEGFEYYSPVTGSTLYTPDKDSVTVYYSTAGLGNYYHDAHAGKATKSIDLHPYLAEYKWGETKPSVLIKFQDTFGYQSFPISLEAMFK
ncbi:MAG: aryl-sulfate sulfotransferase [Sutterellaceae bacterium]|nr:aryl-sulfate sulfotransferase [Sutterellaceae bacterium]MDY2868484.1 aryl-sulfate sulfotransferase [Mesosutterella sp.]